MNTLFITHHYLHGNGGGCYASSAYINAFAEISESLTLLFPMKKDMAPEHINKKVKKVPVWYEKHVFLKLLDLLCGKVHRYTNIEKYIKEEKFDLVVFDTSVVSFRLIDFFSQKGSKTICIHHNYQYEYFLDNTNIFLKFPTLFWCKRYERDAVRKCDLNLTLSDQDIHLLRKYGIGKESFKRIGVFEYERKERKENLLTYKKETTTFIITGTLSDYQTECSLLSWLIKYYPLLVDKIPNHQLLIAGRNPSKKLYNACVLFKNIKIIPNPQSMDEILQQGDFFICPTELGGGLKLRIMDGLRFGLPIISHTVSARGYDDFEKAGYLFSYDSTSDFSIIIERLKTTKIDQEKISSLYDEQFHFEMGVKRIIKICYELMKEQFITS